MPDRSVKGVSGNRTASGIDTSEYLTTLSGSTGRTIFDRMRRSDPQIKATLRAIELPIRQAEYNVEAASDSSTDVEIAETIEKNLLTGMSITWDDTLRHALLSLPLGFSILEKVWELRDGKAYLKKLDPRLPQSITDSTQWKWDQKTDELISIRQRGASGKTYDLPIEKLLVFTNEKEGDNWEGISLLRSCYKPWKIKDDLEKINVINHDRNGVGIPYAKMPQGIKKGTPEWEETIAVLEAFCANEQAYLILPYGAEAGIFGGEGKATDTLASIKFYDEGIARALLAQFINLGTTETGSRALGGSFIDFFLKSLQAYAGYICEVINRFLIREYVDYNWSVKEYPVFKVGTIKDLDPFVIGELQKAGVISKDLDTENLIRRTLKLPEVEEQPVPIIPPQLQPFTGQPKQEEKQIDEQGQNQETGIVIDEKKITASELALSTAIEQFPNVDFRGMELRLNNAATNYGLRIMQIREAQRADIVAQLVEGKGIRDKDIRVIKKKEMYDLLMEAYREQVREGGKDVRKEIEAQGFKLATKKKPPVLTDEEMYSTYAEIQVNGAASKLVSTLLQERANVLGQNLDVEGLKKKLDTVPISDFTWQSMMNGAVNAGWGDGRDAEAEQYADEIDHCIYTSVMDRNTCWLCEQKDGHEHELNDPEYYTPNPECLGRDWCRCLTVYVMKAEALPEKQKESA